MKWLQAVRSDGCRFHGEEVAQLQIPSTVISIKYLLFALFQSVRYCFCCFYFVEMPTNDVTRMLFFLYLLEVSITALWHIYLRLCVCVCVCSTMHLC